MKRLCAVLVVVALMLSLCGCSKVSVNTNADVKLTYVYGDKDIRVTLEDEEAEKIIEILSEKTYNPASSGIPSCSFNKDISIKVGNRAFALACDSCNGFQDLGNLRYFDIPEEDMEYIHSVFEKYGGHFPCV